MPEYLSPGVYIEERDGGPRPITGVSTSTAGAVGVTVKGPTEGAPQLVTSFADFVRQFGGYLIEPTDDAVLNRWTDAVEGGRWWQFAHAVQGFFANGGQRLFVKRVVAGDETNGARAATGRLHRGLVSPLTRDARRDATEIRLAHLFDLDDGAALRVLRGDNGQEVGAFTVASYDAATGDVTLSGPLAEDVRAGDLVEIHAVQATAGDVTLTVDAAARGEWGNTVSVRVLPTAGAQLAILPDPGQGAAVATTLAAPVAPTDTALVVAAVPGRLDTTNPAAPFDVLVRGRRRLRVTAVAAGADANQVRLTVAAPGVAWDVGTAVQILRSADVTEQPPPVDTTLAPAPAPTATDTALTVVAVPGRLDATTPAPPYDLTVDGRTVSVTVAAAGAAAGEVVLTLSAALGANPPAAGASVRFQPPAVTTGLYLGTAGRLYPGAVVELDTGTAKETALVDRIDGALVTFASPLTGTYLEGEVARLVEAEVMVFDATAGAAPVERFSGLRLVRDGSASSLVEHVNARSRYVRLTAGTGYSESDLTRFPTAERGGPLQLGAGADNNAALNPDDFVGTDGGSGNRTGIAALEDIDDVSVVLAPGIWSRTVRDALIGHCETLKDRFAIVDVQDGLTVEQLRARRAVIDTKYAALYHPWVVVRDPLARRDVAVAPSGHLAGIYARVDTERGVHKAPANEVIRGINGLHQDVTKREQDLLNPVGINALRAFPNRGLRVWGARTLSSDTLWTYVNVRRLFIFIEESIDEGTQFVVFEPNTPELWATVRQTITTFLTRVWRSGALFGETPAEAFYVLCDETTMTQDDIDRGLLICEIGISPARPAEFVVFRIQQKTRELQPA